MTILTELNALPGVIAAGEYSYRGDRFSFRGQLEPEHARMASIMCRATTMSVRMQTGILAAACGESGLVPGRGWIVRGPRFSVCVVANVFCFLDNSGGSLNEVLEIMRDRLQGEGEDLV